MILLEMTIFATDVAAVNIVAAISMVTNQGWFMSSSSAAAELHFLDDCDCYYLLFLGTLFSYAFTVHIKRFECQRIVQ